MRAAARSTLSGPLRAALAALSLVCASTPGLAQVAPPARPMAAAPSDAPPPATAYADSAPETARARDSGENRGGAWPAPPPLRPDARAAAAAQAQASPFDALAPEDLPASSFAPSGPASSGPASSDPALSGLAPPPARGFPAAMLSRLEAAVNGPEAAGEAPGLDAVAPDPTLPYASPSQPASSKPAEPLPAPSLAAAAASGLASAASPAPPRRPAAPTREASREPSRAVAIALPDPRSSVRPPRGTPSPAPGAREETAGAAPGGLCGDPRLAGRAQAPIDGPGRCGIDAPVELTHVLGIALTPAAVINCRTAGIFANWLEKGPMREAPRTLGAKITKVRVAASYACRSRNSRPGARLSEHALGNAVDVRAFQLSDGREISPLRSWGKGEAGRFLKAAWSSACGPFGTVLGPGSDGYHMDHLHFDSARRSQAYCR